MTLDLVVKSEIFYGPCKFLIVKESPSIILAYVVPEETTFPEIQRKFSLNPHLILGGAQYEFEKGGKLWVDGFSQEYGGIPARIGQAMVNILKQYMNVRSRKITTGHFFMKNQSLWESLNS